MTQKKNKQALGMVDISEKNPTKRTAIASAKIRMSKQAFSALMKGKSPKGDVLETARVAGVMAAKQTPRIIPLCHPLELSKVSVNFDADKKHHAIEITAQVSCFGRTGVEMEALTAVSVAALTIYDMMKWAGQGMIISDVKLLSKSGGKSGDYSVKKES